MDLATNLKRIHDRIAAACARVNRDPADVTLIAVTKYVDAPTMQALIELGVRDIAENRQQTAASKLPDVAGLQGVSRPRLHFIGPLQRNKVKRVLEKFDVIQSVDSLKLAEEISHRASELQLTADMFVEINIAGEERKSGMPPEQAESVIREIAGLQHIHVLGLMCMAPHSDDAEAARPYFRSLATLSRELRESGALPQDAGNLSMGMSGDFEVAIEEGATHVRIGTALFAS
jgi:hypothetical protein